MRIHPLPFLLTFSCIELAAQPPGKPISTQLLAQPRLGADADHVSGAFTVAGAQPHHTIPAIRVHVLSVPAAAVDRVQQALERTGLFTYVERDGIAHPTSTPNDPSFASQWHLNKIRASDAWDLTTGSLTTPIAIIDSGADPTHPDLSSKLLPGWSFLTGTSSTADTMGHGTAVAGTVAAATNNGIGGSGVAWSNPVMPLVVVDSTGSASYSNMASAITYAADHGARIVNMSLAGTSGSSTLQTAIDYAWNKGTVVFAAAGNYSTSSLYYPAACNNVVAVSSTSSSDTLSGFSNFGNWIDLAAPGESILTTSNGGGYGYWSGTSFASPIAAGVGALVLGIRPALSASALVSLLEQNADDLGTPGVDSSFGWGRVNAYNAVSAALAYAGDATPPSVSISNPLGGSVVSGTVLVSGTATDQVGVVRIELWVDGSLGSSVAASPFSFAWNTGSLANGSHTVMIKAYDAAGNVGQSSASVSINNPVVSDTIPPTDIITSPASGSKLGANTKVVASATDNIGVTQVSIYLDGVLQYTGTTAPYNFNLNAKKLTAGSHTITSKAWDKAGNTASATPVTVYK
jgi:thermitase